MKRLLPLLLGLVRFLHAEVEIVPQPDVNCLPGKTTVWTAAMQAAFDRVLGAKSSMTLDRVEPPNQLVAKMAGFSWKEDAVLPKDGWFAVGGEASAGRVDEANEKWRLLAGARPPPFRYNGASGGRAAFVGMKRDFYFKKPFSTSGASHLAWGPGKLLVQSYGAIGGTADEYTGTVRILAYRPVEGCIALQLLGAESDDTLVLYQPAKNQKMIDAMRWVKIWRERWETHEGVSLAWNDKFPHRGDDLRFPEIRLGAQTDCSDDFKGAFWLKDVTQSQQVTQVAISMRLEVDGITAPDSPARAVVEADPPPPSKPVTGVPRRFWINRHFFAFFWRDGAAWPYAAVWFGSSEGLVK